MADVALAEDVVGHGDRAREERLYLRHEAGLLVFERGEWLDLSRSAVEASRMRRR
jgi:hypothetical protein